MDGIIIVNKQQGWTSHDVCSKIRKLLNVKAGHTGTLDPMAQGVLIVLLGRAARLNEYISGDKKEYIAGVRFGISSDTDDIWGNPIEIAEPDFDIDCLKRTLDQFRGDILQAPPAYSAIKVNGKRLYDYALKGQSVNIEKRHVEIYSMQLLNFEPPYSAEIKVVCSKGTYIRSLCRDLGETLGCGAVMSSLIRTKINSVDIKDAYAMDDIIRLSNENRLNEIILPADFLLDYMQRIDVKRESLRILLAGNKLLAKNIENTGICVSLKDKVRIYCDNHFYAVGSVLSDGIKPEKVFPAELV